VQGPLQGGGPVWPGGGDYRRLGLADELQCSALLCSSCEKSGTLFLHGGQREPGIPEPHEPVHTRERLNEVRVTHGKGEEIRAAVSTVPEPVTLAVWRSTQTRGTGEAAAGGRAEQTQLPFYLPGGKEHGAQQSVPRPGNEVFALRDKTGTRRCLVVVHQPLGFNRLRLWVRLARL
jgi:hypothetical protein